MSIYAILGELFLALIIVTPILLLVAMIFGFILLLTRRRLFPRFTYTILTTFSHPAKSFMKLLNIDQLIFYEILIMLINSFSIDAYRNTSKAKRILFLPHCLRSLECPAKTSPEKGTVCVGCGKCEIGEIIEFAKEKGIEVYIAPGSGFVRRILMEKKPDAAACVACQIELYEIMRYLLIKNIPPQGVLLAKSGCIETVVDWDEVKQMLSA